MESFKKLINSIPELIRGEKIDCLGGSRLSKTLYMGEVPVLAYLRQGALKHCYSWPRPYKIRIPGSHIKGDYCVN